ncbi:MAG: hypothetical protein K2K77_02905 [Duncaniella sp.]|nr:hypothetical protein [Duncaniella sp.]
MMMKQQYLVGGNVFSVTVPDNLHVWQILQQRYAPFVSTEAIKPVLEVEIRTEEELPESQGERICEPVPTGIGMIVTSRKGDGSLVMEFVQKDQSHRRLLMTMPAQRDRAEIVLVAERDGYDSLFLTHAMMIAYLVSTSENGTLMIHASTVLYEGKAYMFQGKSGTGKSTHASLWLANIPGAELLNDDHPIIRLTEDGTAMAYGAPWSGKTHCYRNIAAPIGAMVRIGRSQTNELRRLQPLQAYASLITSVGTMPFLSKESREIRHRTIERLAGAVPCCEMHCRPDADAALTCMTALTK